MRKNMLRFSLNIWKGGECEIQASYPAGKIQITLQNLDAASEGEYKEWGSLYPEFEKKAREEGF